MILSVAVDTERLIILGFTMSRRPTHESIHAPTVLRQAARHRHTDVYVMDKADDAESIHRFVVEDLHAEAMIPTRLRQRSALSGPYRTRAHDWFDPVRYHQRSAVETTFSIMKRK